MTIIVQSSLSSLVPVSQCPSFLPYFYHDHSDDYDDDNEDIQFWWDDYVTEFPADTMEYVAITEYEDNTKYDHNNTVKSVAMF